MQKIEVLNYIHNIFPKLKNLPICFPILDDLYKDKWDILFERDSLVIRIYFPKLKITNSQNFSHTIRDMYFNIVFNKEEFTKITLTGFRTTFTDREYSNRYVHSHLSSGLTYTTMKFCLGDDTDLAVDQFLFIEKLKEEDVDFFIFFFLKIKTFLEWESLEGVPYLYISNLQPSVANTTVKNLFDLGYLDYLASILFYKLSPNSFSVVDFKIELTVEDIQLLKILLYEHYPLTATLTDTIFGFLDSDTNVFIPFSTEITSSSTEPRTLLFKNSVSFKGKLLEVNIINEKAEKNKFEEIYKSLELNPNLLLYIENKVNLILKKENDEFTKKEFYYSKSGGN